MAANPNTVLRITDDVTGRRSTMRIDADDAALPLGALLDRYLERPDVERLSREGRITEAGGRDARLDPGPRLRLRRPGPPPGLLRRRRVRPGAARGVVRLPAAHVADTRGRQGRGPARSQHRPPRGVGYDRNWAGFSKRRWDRRADFYAAFVADAARRAYGEQQAEAIMALEGAGG